MIIVHIMGGLGNQLFQYAVGRALAYRRNAQLKLDITQTEAEKFSHHNYYRLGNFNVQENFATVEEIKSQRRINERDKPVYAFQPEILDLSDGVWLFGYWANEKYFSDIAGILRRELTLKKPLEKISDSWREKILSADCAVSLHVRNGDYLTPLTRNSAGVISAEYYLECINRLKNSCENITLFVFSDDLDWVKKNLNFDVPMEFVEGCEHDYEEMHLMSLCKHNIITHSTFSWWGAWLNKNPDKKVFVPYPWFYDGRIPDVIPDTWIKIPVDYAKHAHDDFPVFLSAIIYVEDASSVINLAGIFSQTLKDCEFIIVDASADANNPLRQFLSDDRITIIKANRFIGKSAAWNLGLTCARSEYVMFLTDKDFILSNTAQMFAQFTYDYLKMLEPGRRYLNKENYAEIFPDIVSSVRILEENPDGQINLVNKKFSIEVDAAFQNLNAITQIHIDAAQKLMLLAASRVNNFIGTKFFKREFLLENKISFDEKLDAEKSELLFLIDSFMRTENIALMPQIFYGRLKEDEL